MSTVRTVHELRRQIATLLAEEGRSIALERPGGFVRTPAGGQARSGSTTPLAPQRFWVMGTRGDTMRIPTVPGQVDVDGATLVGRWDADVKEGDTFTIDTRTFKVLLVHQDRRYETRARLEDIS